MTDKINELQDELADHQVDALRAAVQGNELTTAVLNANAQQIVDAIEDEVEKATK